MIYDNLNNLHKLNHDQQPNCRAVLTFWGTKRIENKYYSRPQILDFHIPLLPCNHSHGCWSHRYKNINSQNIPMRDNLAVKPPPPPPQILDFHIPLLPCNHSHGCWSHRYKNINSQNIPMRDNLAVKPPPPPPPPPPSSPPHPHTHTHTPTPPTHTPPHPTPLLR